VERPRSAYCSYPCQQKAWYQRNQARADERARAWQAANPDKVQRIQRAWYARNREQAIAATTRWINENRGRFNEARNRRMQTAKGRAARTERNQRRRARIMGNGYEAIPAAEWSAKLAAYGGRCAYCGDSATERDHLVPLARGGTHTLDNLVPACGPCNRKKGDQLVSEWRFE